MSGGGKTGVPWLDANSLGVNPWPMVNQATGTTQAEMGNMYADLGLGGGTNVAGQHVGPSTMAQQDQTAIANQGNALGTQLSIQNMQTQASELPQVAQLALSQQNQGETGAGNAGFNATATGGILG